jgi:5-hydroxyisourate hydrolase
MTRSHVTTHVLDAVAGRPAVGIAARLEDGAGDLLGNGVTDADGRIADLGPTRLPPGTYRVVLDTGLWFAQQQTPAFYPEVAIAFRVEDADQHYHVPVLLSPYSYSTYRGS